MDGQHRRDEGLDELSSVHLAITIRGWQPILVVDPPALHRQLRPRYEFPQARRPAFDLVIDLGHGVADHPSLLVTGSATSLYGREIQVIQSVVS